MSRQETIASSSTEIPGFENVDLESVTESTLTCEDLESSKKQLWLIKVPYEFDVSKLSGRTVMLNEIQDFSLKMDGEVTSNKKYETRSSKYKKNESCDFKMLVPSSKAKGSLNIAKDFTGHVDVIQTVNVPMLNYPPTPPQMYTDIPKGLKTRWKPFGHRTPTKIKERTTVEEDKKVKVGTKRKVADEEEAGSHTSPKKKKKKKKKEESGYGSSLQLDDSTNSSKHKKKKKKKHDS